MQIIRRSCGALVILALTHATVAAQGFDTRKIRVGQTVLVRDLTGGQIKGVVESIDSSSLVVTRGTGPLRDPADPTRTLSDRRTFSAAEVDRVLRPGPVWDGAVKGALVALVPALYIGAVDCYGCGIPGYQATMLVVGAGIGLGIDAAWGPKTVYRNRGESRKVTLVPIIGRDRRGLSASVRF